MLELKGVAASYGPIEVLRQVSLQVQRGEIVCLLGGNAAGKSTTLKTILGMLRPTSGSVALEGERIERLPTEDIVARGIALVPESRRIFARMTVWENLTMGAYSRRAAPVEEFTQDLARVYALFPRLEERAGQHGGTLSGGEQQMLAMGRALMAGPKLMMLDEPSMGLAPMLVVKIFDIIKEINAQGTTILLVEQNAHVALEICDRGYVLETGTVTLSDDGAALLTNPHVQDAYLGVA